MPNYVALQAGHAKKIENFLVAGGASQTGTLFRNHNKSLTVQAAAYCTSGAYTATVALKGSNDGTNFITLGTIALSGTGTTVDSDGFAVDAPWKYLRADVSSFTGTGAVCDVHVGM